MHQCRYWRSLGEAAGNAAQCAAEHVLAGVRQVAVWGHSVGHHRLRGSRMRLHSTARATVTLNLLHFRQRFTVPKP